MGTDLLRSPNPIRVARPDRLVLARFSAAELAAAANLVQLSESSGDSSADALGIEPYAASASAAAAARGGDDSSSPRSVNTRRRDAAAGAEEKDEEEDDDDDAVGGGGAPRGRRRRYRSIADLYAATAPIGDGGNAKSEMKRRRSDGERE
ncbi:uncharacterized protein LOC109703640 [Ananas comosus]|uniref:Uncharacterized protein LOC109703640 n=1 Tax=Ananas comosus TaxID=4615 RepID=A0A6P5EEI2_ANACO|nr:uncharacterized protein LOC109703640 [Ananas comosus]